MGTSQTTRRKNWRRKTPNKASWKTVSRVLLFCDTNDFIGFRNISYFLCLWLRGHHEGCFLCHTDECSYKHLDSKSHRTVTITVSSLLLGFSCVSRLTAVDFGQSFMPILCCTHWNLLNSKMFLSKQVQILIHCLQMACIYGEVSSGSDEIFFNMGMSLARRNQRKLPSAGGWRGITARPRLFNIWVNAWRERKGE